MKKVAVLLFGFFFILTGNLFAVPISNTVYFNDVSCSLTGSGTVTNVDYDGWSLAGIGPGGYLSWTQALTPSSPDGTFSNATLMLYLYDDCLFSFEKVYYSIDNGTSLLLDTDVTGAWYNPEHEPLINVSLGSDNAVSVKISSSSYCGASNFYVDRSILTADFTPAAAPVPEPASLVLLGAGLLSAGFFTKKKKND